MSTAGRRSVLLALLLVSSALVAGPVTATTGPSPDHASTPTSSVDIPIAQSAGVNATNETNTSLVQQRDPDELSKQGNHEAVRAWLQGRMATLLANSTVRLSQGQYAAANRTLGGEYEQSLAKYVDVAGSTDRDTETGETFAEVRDRQRAYAATREQYEETYQAYQQARQRGNETRARQLARTLSELGDRLDERGVSLTTTYTALGNQTGISVENEIQRINQTTDSVSNRTRMVVEASFTRTRLTVDTNASAASFTQPLTIQGHVRTANGTPISGPATITVGEQRANQTLASNGSFTYTYRPVATAAGTHTIRVTYQPRTNAPYLGNETTTNPITIEQRTPSLSVTATPAAVRFDDELTIRGTVTLNGTPVPNVPVALAAAGVPLTTATTNASGRYRTRVPLPATVPNGSATLRATTALQGSAIGMANTTTPLRVATTETALSVDGAWQSTELAISGRLTTGNGTGIGARTITLQANGTVLATTQTDGDGTYRVRVQPDMLADRARVSLVAVYDGAETSLAATRATTTVQQPGSTSTSFPSLIPAAGLGALILLIAGGGGLYWRSRRQPRTEPDEPETPAGSAETTTDTPASETPREHAHETLTQAREMMSEDPGRAVETAYVAVRAALDADGGARTHWEFATRVAETESLTDDEWDALRTLTAAYEAAVFSGSGVSREQGVDAIAAAERALGHAERTDE